MTDEWLKGPRAGRVCASLASTTWGYPTTAHLALPASARQLWAPLQAPPARRRHASTCTSTSCREVPGDCRLRHLRRVRGWKAQTLRSTRRAMTANTGPLRAKKYSAAVGVYLLAIHKHTPARRRRRTHCVNTICTCMHVWLKFIHAHAHKVNKIHSCSRTHFGKFNSHRNTHT